jgi:hypothetical protein
MTTLEMMNEAAKTGKTYIASDMRYSVKFGFHEEDKQLWDADAFTYVNDIFAIDYWKALSPVKMTHTQVEEELGYEFELVEK